MVRLATLPTASGAVLLPCFFNSAFTASAGVGCFLASAAESCGIGLGSSAASSVSTACISGSGVAGIALDAAVESMGAAARASIVSPRPEHAAVAASNKSNPCRR